jgi:hypothetical protein
MFSLASLIEKDKQSRDPRALNLYKRKVTQCAACAYNNGEREKMPDTMF